jgi:hypothetical protein
VSIATFLFKEKYKIEFCVPFSLAPHIFFSPPTILEIILVSLNFMFFACVLCLFLTSPSARSLAIVALQLITEWFFVLSADIYLKHLVASLPVLG